MPIRIEDSVATPPIELLDRFEGCLLGLACGDAVGGPAEFHRRGRFPEITGMGGGGKFQLAPGEWTDDTAMALCLAESLLACGGMDPLDQMQRYWRWANEGHHSTRATAFGLGKTVANSLMRFHRTGNPLAGSSAPDTAGNGCLMRLAPVAMYFWNDRQAAIEAAELSARTTHGADECLASCRCLADILVTCFAGATDKEQILSGIATLALPDGLGLITAQVFRDAPREQIRATGYVVDCLEAALWCFWHSGSYAEAVLLAANLGDDADTTAAVCGQIAGAYYGRQGIPDDWAGVLYKRDLIAGMARGLLASTPESPALGTSASAGCRDNSAERSGYGVPA